MTQGLTLASAHVALPQGFVFMEISSPNNLRIQVDLSIPTL